MRKFFKIMIILSIISTIVFFFINTNIIGHKPGDIIHKYIHYSPNNENISWVVVHLERNEKTPSVLDMAVIEENKTYYFDYFKNENKRTYEITITLPNTMASGEYYLDYVIEDNYKQKQTGTLTFKVV